jgi:hypothetical protein
MSDTRDLNANPDPFTPEILSGAATRVRELRQELLFDVDDAGSDPEAEQLFLLAQSALESAERFLKLSSMKQSQALARARGVR